MWYYSYEINVDGIISKKVIGRVRLPLLKEGRKEMKEYELLYTPLESITLVHGSESIIIYPGEVKDIGIGSIQYYENTEMERGEEYVLITIGEILI